MSQSIAAPPPYAIVDGRLQTSTCELNISHQCNLSCRSCGHLAPVASRHHSRPEDLYDVLRVLGRHYRAEHVRLLGGEPLLHPALLDVIDAVLRSGVTARIRVVTNGVLLHRMPAEFWRRVAEVHVSVYPGQALPDDERRRCAAQAETAGCALEFLYFDRFRESYSEQGTGDGALVQRVYDTCQVAHRWRCHNVEGATFYKCPQAHRLPATLPVSGLVADRDGVRIEDVPDLTDRLLAYLQRPDPLDACRFCLGSVGRLFPHEQRRVAWREPQHTPLETLVDWELLRVLEREDPDADSGCLRPEPSV
ncbi:MAG: radical SAM protein [Vicinamibacterales bacterium]